jgi:hypothetical protein
MASFGVGPIYNFTNHLSLAFETGFDHTTSGQNLYGGWLFKNTLAFQVASGREFLSRPVLRLFFTYAKTDSKDLWVEFRIRTRPAVSALECKANLGGKKILLAGYRTNRLPLPAVELDKEEFFGRTAKPEEMLSWFPS